MRVVKTILQMPCVSVTEIALFRALNRWAERHCAWVGLSVYFFILVTGRRGGPGGANDCDSSLPRLRFFTPTTAILHSQRSGPPPRRWGSAPGGPGAPRC